MADITQTGGPQQRVGDGMGQHVGIRMPGQAQRMFHMHTADDQRSPFHQHMQIVTLPDPEGYGRHCCGNPGLCVAAGMGARGSVGASMGGRAAGSGTGGRCRDGRCGMG